MRLIVGLYYTLIPPVAAAAVRSNGSDTALFGSVDLCSLYLSARVTVARNFVWSDIQID